jgi:hypothetical protein
MTAGLKSIALGDKVVALMTASSEPRISKYFSLHEALFLPTWNREATATDGLDTTVWANLKNLFLTMDKVREFFDAPIIIHCAYRPFKYNEEIKGAIHSTHVNGRACDFHVEGLNCDKARQKILDADKLEEWFMRMEDKQGSDWIHLDTAAPCPNRFFKP